MEQPREEHRFEPRPLPATEPVGALPAVSPAAEPAAAIAPAPAPRPEEIRPRVEQVTVDPKEYLASAGLQMVETRAGAATVREPEAEMVKLGRPRRERPRVAEEETLVQVETRK